MDQKVQRFANFGNNQNANVLPLFATKSVWAFIIYTDSFEFLILSVLQTYLILSFSFYLSFAVDNRSKHKKNKD